MSKELVAKAILNFKHCNFHSNEKQLNSLLSLNKNITKVKSNLLQRINKKNYSSSINSQKSNHLTENLNKIILNRNSANKKIQNLFDGKNPFFKSNSIFTNKLIRNFSTASSDENKNTNNINNLNNQNNNNNTTTKKVNFIFVYANGKKEVHVESEVGKNVLEIAHKYEVDLEGACDASLACSTCHVILDQAIFDKIPDAKEEEEDLLDLAFGLTHTSRLGCQVIVTEDFEGAKITIPSATRNLYVDGHKPKPH